MDIAVTTIKNARLRVTALLCVGIVLLALGCSADSETPLGSELVDDILGSEPGVTSTDSVDVINETIHEYYTLIDAGGTLQMGRADDYERAMILRPGFSNAGADTLRTVTKAELRVLLDSTDEVLSRFYHLATPFQEGDSIQTLDTLYTLVDPDANGGSGGARRTMNQSSALYPLSIDTVQAWIRGEAPNNGIVVIYDDVVNDKVGVFKSRSNVGDPATLKVTFSDGSQTFYPIVSDGTFIRPTQATTNSIVSDGFVRRFHFEADLQVLGDSSAVHTVLLRFHIVPGTVLGVNVRVVLFVPDSADPNSEEFLDGTEVQDVFIDEDSGVLEFAGINMILAILGILEGQVEDTGFTIRFVSENSELRQVEFFTNTAPDSLRPRLFITSSTPAEFDQ